MRGSGRRQEFAPSNRRIAFACTFLREKINLLQRMPVQNQRLGLIAD
jgi:hypothetical protein